MREGSECGNIIFFFTTNDTVQPYDTIQVRSDSDFGVKSATVQVYSNSHNSQSNHWIGLIFFVDSSNMFYYIGLKS